MSRIEPVAELPQGGVYRELLEGAELTGTPDERMIRVFANSDLGAHYLRLWQRMTVEGLLPHRLKELVRIRLSVLDTCAYCSSIRSKLAVRQGLDEATVVEMVDLESSTRISDREKAALRFADRYRADDIDDDEAFAALREHFGDAEIIELAILCGLIDGGGKFARALQVITWSEACEVRPSLIEMRDGDAVAGTV